MLNIGISPQHRQDIADGLAHLLADTYTLYLKTHNYHWNVTGPHFNSLHTMFEQQYTELAAAVDEIAERIRALGCPAPGSYRAYMELSEVDDERASPNAMEMVAQLVRDQETVVRTARRLLPIADQSDDQPTADLLTQRMQVHEKTAWMLRSMLDDRAAA